MDACFDDFPQPQITQDDSNIPSEPADMELRKKRLPHLFIFFSHHCFYISMIYS